MRGNTLSNYWTPFARAAAALALVLTLSACGDDDSATATPPEDAPSAPVDDSASEVESEVVEIGAVDFAFTDVPASVAAGTQLTLRNDAATELHELVAFRLDDDETRSLDEILALPQGEMMGLLGEPETVILALPGSDQSITAVGDGTLSEAGRYAFFCFIPTGVDPDEYMTAAATSDGPPDVGDGPPHIVHGMYTEVEVK